MNAAEAELLNEIEGSHVLVIDEPMITHAVRRVLGARHKVSECSSAREALTAIASGTRYDVILCDIRRPGLSGKAFYEAVCDLSPALADRIVFLAAVTSFAPGAQFLHEVPSARRLSKPFRNEELRLAIDGFLRSSGRWKTA